MTPHTYQAALAQARLEAAHDAFMDARQIVRAEPSKAVALEMLQMRAQQAWPLHAAQKAS